MNEPDEESFFYVSLSLSASLSDTFVTTRMILRGERMGRGVGGGSKNLSKVVVVKKSFNFYSIIGGQASYHLPLLLQSNISAIDKTRA